MKTSNALGVALILGSALAMPAQAGGRSLWCEIKAQADAGRVARTTEFIWGGAHEAGEAGGPIATSIGTLRRGDTADATTAILLDGKTVPLPSAATGQIWNGKVFDLGNKIAIAFVVETASDSSASPSEAIVLIAKGSRLLREETNSGEQIDLNRCPLL